jgi:hypothetical protein
MGPDKGGWCAAGSSSSTIIAAGYAGFGGGSRYAVGKGRVGGRVLFAVVSLGCMLLQV